jgi:diguanylate cyclase (GGDEF)-like protein
LFLTAALVASVALKSRSESADNEGKGGLVGALCGRLPMASFKFKLVSYFALVALVPVLGAVYGFDTVAKRRETQRIDNRLRADVRAATAGYAQQLGGAERRAVPISLPTAVSRLENGIDPRDALVAVREGVVVGGPHLHAELALVPGIPGRVVIGSRAYRALLTSPVAAGGDVQFASLVPERELDAAITASRWQLLIAVAAVVGMFGLLVYMLGLSIVRTLGRFAQAADGIARGRYRERVEVQGRDEFSQVAEAFNRMAAQLEQRKDELDAERRRSRELTVRFGKALTATHDVELLLPVIVETMVEATGAEGGVVQGRKRELARAGDPDADARKLELPLTVAGDLFGKVVLTGSFDDDEAETASLLAAQAAVALENAELHTIVERQALVDPLTGLANRRSLEESLQEEVSRAQRFDGDLCFVLADLDRFKAINDRYGHPTGDRALRVFAQTLKDVVREVDGAGRWGGEEFALILPGTGEAGGVALAERVREALAAREIRAPNGDLVQLTASFGAAAYPESRDQAALVAAADQALYWAKRDGRDRVTAAIGTARR